MNSERVLLSSSMFLLKFIYSVISLTGWLFCLYCSSMLKTGNSHPVKLIRKLTASSSDMLNLEAYFLMQCCKTMLGKYFPRLMSSPLPPIHG